MSRLKIKFHPFFVIYVFICIYFGWYNSFFFYVVVATLHEYGHYFVLKMYGYEMKGITYSLSGAGLVGNTNFKDKHEIIISLAGPFVNLILIFLTIAFWWIFPSSYLFTYDFFITNIIVGIFNLLPIYPLDGGRILSAVMSMKNIKKSYFDLYNKIISIVIGCVLFLLFIFSFRYEMNISFIVLSAFFILNSMSYNKTQLYSCVDKLNKTTDKPLEVKVFRTKECEQKKLIKYISPHYYSIFEIEKGEDIITIEENDLYD